MFKLFPEKEAISSELALLHKICSAVNSVLVKPGHKNSDNHHLNVNYRLKEGHYADTFAQISWVES